ncbi:EAL domain-containing protein [Tunturiibacter gelidiferens]|uniref:EAL domain-containing protein n=1 Tax=Tunturiibacter gelidiferens TaxID=3069689 RepID=UPI003D9BD659
MRRTFPEFQIVLQPIVDLETETVYAYEALCRGPHGENYSELVKDFEPSEIPAFDKLAMARSLRLAAAMRLEESGVKLAINLGPLMELRGKDAYYVVRLAKHYGLRTESLVLELSEGVRLDGNELARIVDLHRKAGVVIAIDDFGAGYAGLSVLARCAPDVVKIDRELIKGIASNRAKKTIVEAFSKVCRKLRVKLIAEGVETVEEYLTLRGFGIRYMQGFLFARPAGCEIPQVRYPRSEPKHFPGSRGRSWSGFAMRSGSDGRAIRLRSGPEIQEIL